MRKFLSLCLAQLRPYLPWLLGTGFLALVFLSCGLARALCLEELKAVFGPFSLWVALRGLLRELWCFALLLLCLVHFIGAPIALCVLCFRAYAIGFAWAWWLCTLGFGGIFSFLLCLLPQGLLVLLALCIACSIGLAHAFKQRPLDRRSYVLALFRCCLAALCALPLEWISLGFML